MKDFGYEPLPSVEPTDWKSGNLNLDDGGQKDFNLEPQKDHSKEYYVGYYKTFGKQIETLLKRVRRLELTEPRLLKLEHKILETFDQILKLLEQLETMGFEDLNAFVEYVDSDLKALHKLVDGLEEDLETLDGKVDENYNVLDSKIDKTKGELNTLIETNKKDIELKLKESVEELNSKLEELNGKLESNYEELLSLIKKNEKDIETINQDHIPITISNSVGVHGIRYFNEKLEIIGEDGEWIEIETGDGTTKPDPNQRPFPDLKGIKFSVDGNGVKINWEDPEDMVVSEEEIFWKGTKLLKKKGSFPQHEGDGIEILNNTTRNKYKENPFIDSEIEVGVPNYYILVPYTDKNYTVSRGNRFKVEFNEPDLEPVKNLEMKEGSYRLSLTWEDPDDGEFSKWIGTKVIRKEGSFPKDENDGKLVLTSSIRNQYKDNPFIDLNLDGDTTYYYLLIPFTKNKATINDNNRISGKPLKSKTFSFRVDEENANTESAVTYTGNAVDKTPMRVSDYGSWEEVIKEWATPVVLKNGKIQYELDHEDFTKKKDGSSSNLTGEDGDVMIRFKHLYVKDETKNNIKNVTISDTPFEGGESYTLKTERGYNQLTWGVLTTLQHLYLLLYKDRNSQTALGKGYRASGEEFAKTGGTSSKPFCYGSVDQNTQQVKFLGIEDFWGNKYQAIDGIISTSAGSGMSRFTLKVGYSNFNSSGEGYESVGPIMYGSRGYFETTHGGELHYIGADTRGDSARGYSDFLYTHEGAVVYFGGDGGSSSGVFCLENFFEDSYTTPKYSSRVCFIDNDFFYVGAYLGSLDGSRLRSVIGKTPIGNRSFSEYRKMCQMNN